MVTRSSLIRLLLVVPLLAGAIALAGPRQARAAQACTTEQSGGTIKDSIVVPEGESCQLYGVVVRGGITVNPGADLTAIGTEIRGSLSAGAGSEIYIVDSDIRGTVTAVEGESSVVFHTVVRGDVTINGTDEYAQLANSTVRGRATLNGNGTLDVFGNQIGTDLACTGNAEVVTGGAPNTVGGVTTGDCVAP